MDKKHFNCAEQDIRKYINEAIIRTQKELEPISNERGNALLYNKTVEARHDTGSGTNNMNNDIGSDTNNMNNDNVKTLVRKNQYAPRVVNNSELNTQNVQNEQSIYKQYANVPSDDSHRNSGNANASTILIVIASFVIVAMLIIIVLTLLGEFGMLPLS